MLSEVKMVICKDNIHFLGTEIADGEFKPYSSCSVAKITSSSSKSVFLHDWWLIKADGKGLTIGGRTYKHKIFDCGGMETLYRSALIVKRHDATTLETKDGMKVRISAKINRHNTLGNGFSIKVWNRFMLGFPCDWEQYSSEATRNESSSDKPNNILPSSFDQVPVRNIRNLVSTVGVNGSVLMLTNIYEDIQTIKRIRQQKQLRIIRLKSHRKATKFMKRMESIQRLLRMSFLEDGFLLEA